MLKCIAAQGLPRCGAHPLRSNEKAMTTGPRRRLIQGIKLVVRGANYSAGAFLGSRPNAFLKFQTFVEPVRNHNGEESCKP
jgi:hypothetical protein